MVCMIIIHSCSDFFAPTCFECEVIASELFMHSKPKVAQNPEHSLALRGGGLLRVTLALIFS